jgi:hypothetical protein
LTGCGGAEVEGTAEDAATQVQTAVEGAIDDVASVTSEVGQAVDNGLTVQLNEQNGSGESGTADVCDQRRRHDACRSRPVRHAAPPTALWRDCSRNLRTVAMSFVM